MIYLDTHIAVWLYACFQEKFPLEVVRILNENELQSSPIMRPKLQYLYVIQRIRVTLDHLIADLNGRIGSNICDKIFSKTISRAMSQTWVHDPFDRLITAHASLNDNILLARDRTILANYQFAVWEW